MSRKKKSCIIRKSVINQELERYAHNHNLEHFTLYQLAKKLEFSSVSKIYDYIDKPITENIALRFAKFFDVSLEYLAAKTPYRNIRAYDNSNLNKKRLEQLELLRAFGFKFELGAFAHLTLDELKQYNKYQYDIVLYDFAYNFSWYEYAMKNLKANGDCLIRVKGDFTNYHKGLNEFVLSSFRLKGFSAMAWYSFVNDNFNVITLDEFDNMSSAIQDSIKSILDSKIEKINYDLDYYFDE